MRKPSLPGATRGSSSNRPRVAISILNWNNGQDTVMCLGSLSRLKYPNWFAIVIDNNSADGSARMIRDQTRSRFGDHVLIVQYSLERACRGGDRDQETALKDASAELRIVSIDLPENLGFDGGHNVGIRYALLRDEPVDFVLLLNNDTDVAEDLLDRLVEAASVPGVGIAGALVIDALTQKVQFARSRSFFYHFFFPIKDQARRKPDAETWPSNIVHGAALMIRRELLERIHEDRGFYLNPILFAYHDELDLCLEARRLGYRTAVAGRAVVRHRNGFRPELPQRSLLFHYYLTRNAILLARTLLPLPKRVLFHVLHTPLALRRAAKMRLLGKRPAARAILLGLRDGYRRVGGKWEDHDVVG